METFFHIAALSACYGLLFLLTTWVSRKGSESLLLVHQQKGNWQLLHVRHAGGIIIMVALPALTIRELPTYLLALPSRISWTQVIVFNISVALLVNLGIKNRPRLVDTINDDSSYIQNTNLHIALRSIFLISYEWFFRGVLLFGCMSITGAASAILINLVLYAFIHGVNGKREVLGSIPFGLLLCLLTIWCHSVWPAVVLHLILSFSYESSLLSTYLKKSKIIL
ncbi:MAG TPA: CPBP family intramembrane metalloprotease [Chitinophagaceae bacterium]|mgnify:CR=1 FL=1|nr:CPBP family intramembrane metalloprotease [Chitinophagaceae bacterium]